MGNLKLWNWSFEDQLFIARNIVSSGHYRYPIPRFGNFLKRNVFLVLAQKLSVGANIRPLELCISFIPVADQSLFPEMQNFQENPTKLPASPAVNYRVYKRSQQNHTHFNILRLLKKYFSMIRGSKTVVRLLTIDFLNF